MNEGLKDARAEKNVGQRIGDRRLSGEQRDNHEPPEYGQAFHAVRMRPGKTLHEGGEVRVVRTKPVCGDSARDDKLGADDLHEHKQDQRPGDKAGESSEGGVHVFS